MTAATLHRTERVRVDDVVNASYTRVERHGACTQLFDRAVTGTVRHIQQVSPTVHKITVHASDGLDWVLDTRIARIEVAS